MTTQQQELPPKHEKTWPPEALTQITDREVNLANLWATNQRLQRQVQRSEKHAFLDPLTGLGNHRYFVSSLRAELRRAARSEGRLGLVLCDIDDFKACNDRYGHAAGDAVLVTVSECIKQHCRRGGDFAFRHGGDEFALLLPDISADALRPLCEDVRRAIKNKTLADQRGEPVTVSIGAAVAQNPSQYYSAALIEIANRALYRAKRYFKDCVKINVAEHHRALLRSVP